MVELGASIRAALRARARAFRQESGQGLIEYALILLLVSVAMVLSLAGLSGALITSFLKSVAALP